MFLNKPETNIQANISCTVRVIFSSECHQDEIRSITSEMRKYNS